MGQAQRSSDVEVESTKGSHPRRALWVTAAAFLGIVVAVTIRYQCRPVLDKISEELSNVNETVHQTRSQFSLKPFTADPQEFRDSLEQWSLYFKEIGNMAVNALNGPMEESPLLLASTQAIPFLVLLCLLLLVSTAFWTRVIQAFLLALLLVAGLSWHETLQKMASINQGLHNIVGDLREDTMQDLLQKSNRNDEYLQLMLLVTGHLKGIDERPVWACASLPHPFNIEHSTIRTAYHGSAVVEGCLPVTYNYLLLAFSLAALPLFQVVRGFGMRV